MGLLSQTQQEYYDGNDYGGYQFISLNDIINYFKIAYVGEDKIISKVSRTDVAFHAQRALTELSFDTLKSHKAQEITLPSNLQMILPQDYVNYTRVLWVDSSGIKHPIYPTKHTQNPSGKGQNGLMAFQNDNGEFVLEAIGSFTGSSQTVVLDGEYDIVTGMIATVYYPGNSAGNVSDAFVIQDVTNTSGITTIKISSNWSYDTQDRAVFFSFNNGTLIPKTKETVTLDGVNAVYGGRSITAASASDASKVEIGMYVIHDDLDSVSNAGSGTPKVVDIQGSIIYINEDFASAITSGQVNFISYEEDSETWKNYKSATPSENNNDDYKDDTYWPADGERYGLDPQHAQVNGSFFIDDSRGLIHFSSNLSGKTIVLDYISDSLGTDGEMIVHKFAEEAMYKWIAHAVLSTRANVPEFQIARFKKERFAAVRTAKLRLSNIKLEEITQILRGKSKQIKH